MINGKANGRYTAFHTGLFQYGEALFYFKPEMKKQNNINRTMHMMMCMWCHAIPPGPLLVGAC
jgi:hypothetical protein